MAESLSKLDYFDYMKRRLTSDIREERIAIRYDTDPRACSEYWYLVDADDRRGYTVQPVHDVIPVSQYEVEKPLLEKMFGTFQPVGKTYEFPPFLLGIKRFEKDSVLEEEFMKQLLSDRENYKIIQYNNALDLFFDPEEKDITDGYRDLYHETPEARPKILKYIELLISSGIDNMSDKEFTASVGRMCSHKTRDNHLVSYKEAQKKGWDYWASDAERENELLAAAAEKMNTDISMYKKLNFAAATPV